MGREHSMHRNYSKDMGVDVCILLKLILRKQGGREWTEVVWLRIGTSGRLL
jgi:hypothetical protein